jgi:membrane protein DedA with SNARE-associated domain
MFHIATSDLMHLLSTYGYWAVLVFVAIESTGIPFPGETMLLVAAIYAGRTHQLSIALVIAAAATVGLSWVIIWASGSGVRVGTVCCGAMVAIFAWRNAG